jgi:hypothetical protein
MGRVEIPFGGLYNSVAANRIPNGRAFTGSNFTVDQGILQLGQRDIEIGRAADYASTDICWGLGYGKYTTNQVQQINITGGIPTSGGFQLSWNGQGPTGTIPYNASAQALPSTLPQDVQSLLLGLSNLEYGEATVTGGPFPYTPINVSFGANYAGTEGPLMTYSSNTMNNSAVPTITEVVAGGTFEVYLVVVQHLGNAYSDLYAVTSSNGFQTTTWTKVVSNQLQPGNWQFQQFQDKIYGVNGNMGIGFYQIGAPAATAWSFPAGISGVQAPANMNIYPVFSYPNGFVWTSVSGVTYSYSGFGSNPTPSLSSSNLNLTLNAALQQSNASVTFNWTSGAIDFSKQGYWVVQITCASGAAGGVTIDPATILLQLTNNAGTPVTVTPFKLGAGSVINSVYNQRDFYFHEQNEGDRKTIVSMTLSFNVTAAASGSIITVWLYPLDVWQNDSMSSIQLVNGPTLKTIQYGATYRQTSTGLETKMSRVFTSGVLPATEVLNSGGNAPSGVGTPSSGSPVAAPSSGASV